MANQCKRFIDGAKDFTILQHYCLNNRFFFPKNKFLGKAPGK